MTLLFATGRARPVAAALRVNGDTVLDDAVEAAIDDEPPAEIGAMPEPAPQHVSQQSLVFGAGEVGQTQFPPQTGVAQSTQPNGKAKGAAPPARSPQPSKEKNADGKTNAPPVPRPRLLLNRLRSE